MSDIKNIFQEKYLIPVTLFIVFLMGIFPIMNYDIFWHLANGREMLKMGEIVNKEIFSYSAYGKEFGNREWLSQIIFYLIYKISGLNGLIIFKSLIITTAFYFLYKIMRCFELSKPLISVVIILGVIASIIRYITRPEMFSTLFLCIILYLYFAYRENKISWKYLLFIPFIIFIWDFIQGSVLGFVLLITILSAEIFKKITLKKGWFVQNGKPLEDEKLKKLLMIFGLSLLMFLINPYGFWTLAEFIGIMTKPSPMMATNQEFQTANIRGAPYFWPYMVMLSLLVIWRIKKIDFPMLFIYSGYAFIAMLYFRGISMFVYMTIPVFCYLVNELRKEFVENEQEKRIFKNLYFINVSLVLFFAVYIKLFNPFWNFGLNLKPDRHPVETVDFIKTTNLKGNMYNRLEMGGYLAFNLYPEQKIFMYGLSWVFDSVTDDFRKTDIFEKYNLEYAFAVNEYETNWLAGKGWQQVFWSENSALFVKNSEKYADFIAKYKIDYFTFRISDDELNNLLKKPEIIPKLIKEISQHLRFVKSEKYSNLLADLMMSNNAAFAPEESLRLLKNAQRKNGENEKLKRAVKQITK
ncbi:MAG: hypothetical protein OEZ13_12685 [Spirochaetia bacterium]|nr:hypothetical protein [Spirochaetia bacterium]